VAHQQAVEERPEDQVECQVDVGWRDDQTLGDTAFEHQAGGVAIARDEFVAECLGELGLGLRRRDHGGDAPAGGCGKGVGYGMKLGAQGGERRARGLAGTRLSRGVEEGCHRHGLCIGPVAVDRGAADARLGRDRLDGDRGETAPFEQGARGGKDGGPGARIARPATAGRRRGLTHDLLTLRYVT